MKILVAVKRVIDPYVKIRIKSDGSGVDTQNVKMAMNPFDEIAVEEAIRLKEQGLCSEIVLVSVGSQSSQETLRHGLALGADSAILVSTEEPLVSLDIAKILKLIVLKEEPSLVLMGKQAIDGDNNQTPQMLAALLDWPQATNVSKLTLQEERVEVIREVDGGLETLQLAVPAIISTDLRLNEPRYASLPNIMKAKRKSLQVLPLGDLDIVIRNRCKVSSVSSPPKRTGGVMVSSVEELVDKLQNEAKVL